MAANLVAAKHGVNVNNLSATHFKKQMVHERCIHLPQFKTHTHYHSVSRDTSLKRGTGWVSVRLN